MASGNVVVGSFRGQGGGSGRGRAVAALAPGRAERHQVRRDDRDSRSRRVAFSVSPAGRFASQQDPEIPFDLLIRRVSCFRR